MQLLCDSEPKQLTSQFMAFHTERRVLGVKLIVKPYRNYYITDLSFLYKAYRL
jgi:hypothetical protein